MSDEVGLTADGSAALESGALSGHELLVLEVASMLGSAPRSALAAACSVLLAEFGSPEAAVAALRGGRKV